MKSILSASLSLSHEETPSLSVCFRVNIYVLTYLLKTDKIQTFVAQMKHVVTTLAITFIKFFVSWIALSTCKDLIFRNRLHRRMNEYNFIIYKLH